MLVSRSLPPSPVAHPNPTPKPVSHRRCLNISAANTNSGDSPSPGNPCCLALTDSTWGNTPDELDTSVRASFLWLPEQVKHPQAPNIVVLLFFIHMLALQGRTHITHIFRLLHRSWSGGDCTARRHQKLIFTPTQRPVRRSPLRVVLLQEG